jgi:hypothetical protein
VSFNAARSDAQGTVLPRYGFFPAAIPPNYRAAVIKGELPNTSPENETSVYGRPELYGFQTAQTPSLSTLTNQFSMALWRQTGSPIVRNTDAAYAFLSYPDQSTNSFWQETRARLRPLDPAVDAILEDINDTLRRKRDISAQRKHAGLSAVARLVEMLDLRRPTVLRMGGVSESTFYSWQKSPNSIIRTPTVTRLLRLQAQVGLLDEVLGRNRMRTWMLSGDRLIMLQGDEAEFAHALAEARAALEESTRITPRRRMRRSDYATGSLDASDRPPHDPSGWPGAAKVVEEEAERPE